MKKTYFFILVVLLFVFLPMQNFAQKNTHDNSTFQEKRKLPTLGNHHFTVNSVTRSPFIKTYLRNTLGAGQAMNLEVPIIEIDGEYITGLRGNLIFANLDFEYQYAVNKWLAVWTKFGLISRLGSNTQAILAQGVNATVSFELGWLMEIYRTDKILLSGSINLWNNSGSVVNIYDFIQNVIDNGEVTEENQLIINQNYIQGGGGFRLAWAASRLVGINVLAEIGYGESINQNTKNDLFYKLAVSSDFDLMSQYQVPLGFVLGFQLNTFSAGTDQTIKDYTSAIFFRTSYTGQSNYLVSIDMSWQWIPQVQTNNTLNATSIGLSLELYF